MQRQNSIIQQALQIKKQIGNANPETFLQEFVEKNNISQSMLNAAQEQATQVMQLLGIK